MQQRGGGGKWGQGSRNPAARFFAVAKTQSFEFSRAKNADRYQIFTGVCRRADDRRRRVRAGALLRENGPAVLRGAGYCSER